MNELEQLMQSLRNKMTEQTHRVKELTETNANLKELLRYREMELDDCVQELCQRCRESPKAHNCPECRWNPIRRGGKG